MPRRKPKKPRSDAQHAASLDNLRKAQEANRARGYDAQREAQRRRWRRFRDRDAPLQSSPSDGADGPADDEAVVVFDAPPAPAPPPELPPPAEPSDAPPADEPDRGLHNLARDARSLGRLFRRRG